MRVRSLRGSPSYVTYVPASRVRAKAATLGCTWPPRQVSSHQQDRSPPLNSGCLQHPSRYQSIDEWITLSVCASVFGSVEFWLPRTCINCSVNQSVCQSVRQSGNQLWLLSTSINQSIKQSVKLSISLSMSSVLAACNTQVNLSVCQPVSRPCLSVNHPCLELDVWSTTANSHKRYCCASGKDTILLGLQGLSSTCFTCFT